MFPNQLFPVQLFSPHLFSRNTDAGIVNDTLTFSQTVTELKKYNVNLSDTLTFSQNIKFVCHVSLSDTLTFSQTVAELKKYKRSLSNTLTFSQNAINSGIIGLHDTLTFSQTLTRKVIYLRSLPIAGGQSTYRVIVKNEPSIVSYWPLNETSGITAFDITGFNNGTYTVQGISGGFTLNQPGAGLTGPSVLFNGISGSVTSFGSLIGIPSGAASFAYEVLFKFNPISFSFGTLIGFGRFGTTNESCSLRIQDLRTIVLSFGSNDLIVSTSSNLNDGTWHHLVGQFDGTTRSIYLDTVLLGTDAPTGKNTTLASLNIASEDDDDNNTIQAYISNVSIYNAALTRSQIITHYNAIPHQLPTDFINFNNVIAPSFHITISFTDHLNFIDSLHIRYALANRHLLDHLNLNSHFLSQFGTYHYVLHDQLRLTDSVIWTYPPIFRENLTDKLILLDDVNAHGNAFARVLDDVLIFADGTYKKYVEGVSFNVPVLIGTKIPGGFPISGGTDPTRRRSGGNYHDSNLNYNPNLPYIVLQTTITTIVLPAPLFGDTQTNVGSIIINRAVDGTIYTVIKPTNRNRLKWKFDVKRQKSYEMQNFLKVNYLEYINVTDFKGNMWYMRVVNNPVVFEAVSKDGSCTLNNERHQFELELEGFLVSSQALPC